MAAEYVLRWNMSTSVTQLLLVVIIVCFGVLWPSAEAMAQCGSCAPRKNGPTPFRHYTFDPSFPEWAKPTFDEAADEWNSHLADAGTNRRIWSGSGTGHFSVVVDWFAEGWGYFDNGSSTLWIAGSALEQSSGFIKSLFLHELGHSVNYGHADCNSILFEVQPTEYYLDFTSDDECALYRDFGPEPGSGGNEGWCGKPCTPIILDLDGDGLLLTCPRVYFNLTGRRLQRFGWPSGQGNDAFLAFDRNGNGRVDDGAELFGSFTPLSWTSVGRLADDGFEALRWFDRKENGGNRDGILTDADRVFHRLLVWQDRNVNGVSEGDELADAKATGVISVSLRAVPSSHRDAFGNWSMLEAAIRLRRQSGEIVEAMAYDVVLATNEMESTGGDASITGRLGR